MRPLSVLLVLLMACDKPPTQTITPLPGNNTPTTGCPDADSDGVCDAVDACTGDDTSGDLDQDGVCDDADDDDDDDGCIDGNDLRPLVFSLDSDLDGVADDCDPCPSDNPDDTDGDLVCDSADTCPGGDDLADRDSDTVPDDCDICPDDLLDDSDGDLVCDSQDLCPGSPDGFDPDGDGVPEACDPCPGENPNDTDGDLICDSADVCDGGDDHFDLDGDGVPDFCDPCPLDFRDDSDGDGSCDFYDTCPGYVDGAPDADGDGFDIASGDCDDCDPLMGPQNFDIPASLIDEDCDGVVDGPRPVCDAGLSLGNTDPYAAAAAMELCDIAPPSGYGVTSARFVRANGAAVAGPSYQSGLLPDFGNIGVQHGNRMLGLSTGRARDATDAGACGSLSCAGSGASVPPPGFPQDVPGCIGGTNINDDVALELELVAPMNAIGFTLRFYFMSFEFPEFVCTEYNDQFIIKMDPPPVGAINGNIAVDSLTNPVSVNLAYMQVCDPSSTPEFAYWCFSGCPSVPSPYCPLGASDLNGTGFDTWDLASLYANGGTGWLDVSAPVTPGQRFTLRLAIWDTYDALYDSTVLLDNFEWVADPVYTGVQPQ